MQYRSLLLIAALITPVSFAGDLDRLLSESDLDKPCIQAMKKADPELKFSGGQFLVMQRAVQLADPLTAVSFYEDPSHSKHFISDMLDVWDTQCREPGQSLEEAARAVAAAMNSTFPDRPYIDPMIATGDD